MINIEDVGNAAAEFLKKAVGSKEVKVIKVARLERGWEAESEVYEQSSFIRSLGLSTRVLDRNIYVIKLNDSLEVESYEKICELVHK